MYDSIYGFPFICECLFLGKSVFFLWINRLRFDLKQLQVSNNLRYQKELEGKKLPMEDLLSKEHYHEKISPLTLPPSKP